MPGRNIVGAVLNYATEFELAIDLETADALPYPIIRIARDDR
jgi:hypothetical protein